jgi:hypothetical protein
MTPLHDTYLCARNSGDQGYLTWLQIRLIRVYKEPEDIDFVMTLSSFRDYFERRRRVPKWLNYLLRKYDL